MAPQRKKTKNRGLLLLKTEYEEYLSSVQMGEIIQKLEDYVKYGGFPEIVCYREEWDRILSEIVDVTIFRDIVERFDVKNIKILKLFLNAIFNSKEFSIHKFYNFLKSQDYKVSKNAHGFKCQLWYWRE